MSVKIVKKCHHCKNDFSATCGAARYCCDRCHLLGCSVVRGECVVWTSGRDKDGYGMVRFRGRRLVRAHRASYVEFLGVIPLGMMVCHACDNPACIKPEHLFLGTARDNKYDCVSKRRHVMGRRVHWKVKLTEADVELVRNDSRSSYEMAAVLGVTAENIQAIRKGKTWKHLL